ncbi:hypothetical protein DVA86_00810 [Streptomyces armeniacus]|uniref:Peptide chain release factor 1 n=1 Tax=Streptomyces armeniacus TaxID=83291 RepID=A0A345XID5_9ACTN|nr:hypothetical protein [Streptomyces armeniacus]AXK31401.1 hypothetical protein DVA86_00810 [Streptomyces armeniacus]
MELGFLSPLFDRPGPWASVYFDTTTAPGDAASRQQAHAHAACARLRRQGADQGTCRAVYDVLAAAGRPPQPPGRAVFAAHGEVVLAPPLATPPPGGGPHACWEALPHTGPLLELLERHPVALAARVHPAGADLELHGPLGIRDAGRVRDSEAVADALSRCFSAYGAELLVLAGDVPARRALHAQLPARLRNRTVQAARGSRRPLADEVARARNGHSRERTSTAMARFVAGRVPTDDGRVWATENVHSLADAAREHRIGSLLIRPDGANVHREVWVGEDPDQMAVDRTGTEHLGGPPATARADDALLRAAAVTGAEVVCVRPGELAPDAPAGLPAGGLGALLRWPYGGTREGGGRDGGRREPAARQ